jgi:hypothetical protein
MAGHFWGGGVFQDSAEGPIWRAGRRVGFAIFVRNFHLFNDFKWLGGRTMPARNE